MASKRRASVYLNSSIEAPAEQTVHLAEDTNYANNNLTATANRYHDWFLTYQGGDAKEEYWVDTDGYTVDDSPFDQRNFVNGQNELHYQQNLSSISRTMQNGSSTSSYLLQALPTVEHDSLLMEIEGAERTASLGSHSADGFMLYVSDNNSSTGVAWIASSNDVSSKSCVRSRAIVDGTATVSEELTLIDPLTGECDWA